MDVLISLVDFTVSMNIKSSFCVPQMYTIFVSYTLIKLRKKRNIKLFFYHLVLYLKMLFREVYSKLYQFFNLSFSIIYM